DPTILRHAPSGIRVFISRLRWPPCGARTSIGIPHYRKTLESFSGSAALVPDVRLGLDCGGSETVRKLAGDRGGHLNAHQISRRGMPGVKGIHGHLDKFTDGLGGTGFCRSQVVRRKSPEADDHSTLRSLGPIV